jgi:hypothetical protein
MYNCHVRLGGTTTSEVPLYGISAAEIIVLRHVHGLDAVVRIEAKNQATASNSAMRELLQKKYEGENKHGMINSLFGPSHMPLPQELDPESEALARQAVKDAEAKAARDDKVIEAEVEKRVAEQMAQLHAGKMNVEQVEIVNSDGVLTPLQIEAREAKRASALAASKRG